jgi:hypothetical protein
MKHKRAEDLLRRLASIAGSAKDIFAPWNRRHILFESWFTLIDDEADAYEEIVSELLHKDQLEQRFSRPYVSGAVSRIITALVGGEPDTAKSLLEDLVNEFETFALRYTIYFPLAGIDMTVPVLNFGNVELVKLEREFFDQAFDVGLAPATDFAPVYARTEVLAESDRAFQIAEHRTRRIFNLLRYTLLFARKRPARPRQLRVGLHGEIPTKARMSFAECSDREKNTVSRNGLGPLQGVPIDADWIGLMHTVGVFEMAALLSKVPDELTDYEKTLIRGLHWVANAQTQDEPENELLNLVTALETYFTPSGRDPVTVAIAEGVAFLLGKNKMERIALKRATRELYARRSAVSHGGQTVVEQSELFKPTEIARDVTKHLIERRSEFTTRKALLDWIEDQKMGS